jgi:quinol monooxygenase YgiN
MAWADEGRAVAKKTPDLAGTGTMRGITVHWPARRRIDGGPMAIRHVITIQVAPGRTADFARAFRDVQALAAQDAGCEQYELFQSLEAPDRLVLLERWASRALLEQHMAAEQRRDPAPVTALMALLAPGSQPQIERFETDV